jgi:transketolase
MRQAFAERLLHIAERDKRVVLLTGDLGFTVLEPFAERVPDRFFNVGVAEQNMVGVATGLAEAGFIPFTYSIATFASLRPYEFIRNGPVAHRLPVRIVGVGGGLDYGHNGISHYALEDVAIMRAQPGMTVVVPADADQVGSALDATWDLERPVYLRLGKEGSAIPGLNGRFELGRAATIGNGGDVAIVALGSAARQAVEAAELLEEEGVACTVAVVSSMNPTPVEDLAELFERVPAALTVEAHYLVGGLGSLASEVVAEQGSACRIVRCGVGEMPAGICGSPAKLYERFGMSPPQLARSALGALEMVGPLV